MLAQVNRHPPGRDLLELKEVRREAFEFNIIMSNTLKTIFYNLIVTGHLQVLGPRLYEVPNAGIKKCEILKKNILFELETL